MNAENEMYAPQNFAYLFNSGFYHLFDNKMSHETLLMTMLKMHFYVCAKRQRQIGGDMQFEC